VNLSRRFSIIVLLIVFLSIGISCVFSFSVFRYLADGERGLRRIEVQEFWGRQVPIALGLGGIAAAAIIYLARSYREKRRNDAVTVAGVGALGVMLLLTVITLFHQVKDLDPSQHRLPTPKRPAEVFSRIRWRALGEQIWREERPMGPVLEYGPGLRDFVGYVPFEPCLLKRLSFEDMTLEQVVRVLGPLSPIPAVFPDTQYLEYKMIEPSPRGRIANLVFRFRFTMEQGQIVVGENLYPERITADCSNEHGALAPGRDQEPYIPDRRSTGQLVIE